MSFPDESGFGGQSGGSGSPAGALPAEPVRSEDMSADLGLLAPTWAGSPVENATGDAAVLRAMLDAEVALVRAQAALGLVPGEVVPVVEEAVDAGRYDVRELALRARAGGNPVIPLVADLTAAVARRSPEAASYVHLGATSQDILDTALMSVAARARSLIVADLDRTASALALLADEHRDSVMPARTLTQHAVPTTFGLKVAGWRDLVLDARDRLHGVRLPAQLGGAAGTLAAIHAYAPSQPHPVQRPDVDQQQDVLPEPGVATPPDGVALGGHGGASSGGPSGFSDGLSGVSGERGDDGVTERDLGLRLIGRFAVETGLAEPTLPWHVLRTPIADLGTALAFAAAALGKIAADVLVLSRTEIGEVAEGAGGGSSAMPHKSNPVRATLIASAARQAPALAAVLLGSPAAEDERPPGAWHAEWQPLRELLRIAGGAAASGAELAEGLRVDPGRMRANIALTRGLVVAERLTAALTPLVGRKEARRLVERASRRTVAEGVSLEDALRDEPEPMPLAKEELHALLDPATYVGSAGSLIDRALRRQAKE